MSTIDIKELLAKLDSSCLGFLEKASQFCLQQHHPEVTPEHYLLQMLNGRNNQFNQLLETANIDPVVWIKLLLLRVDSLKNDHVGNPVFSQNLLEWFTKADTEASVQSSENTLRVSDLLPSLFRNPQLYRVRGLKELDELDLTIVEDFFTKKPVADLDVVNACDVVLDNVEPDDDSTMLMSENEIADSTLNINPDNDELEISGYAQLQKIGEGGMASVYRASHKGLERDVALKVLKSWTDNDHDFVARFLREARIVAKLAHPNIIQIYDVNQASDSTYIAMEFVSGGELSDRMDSGFSVDQTVKILSQVLAALQSAHDMGFIHRDIKPANILFREDESIVLTDFGIARIIGEDSDLTMAGDVLGTPRYMSPEQARGDSLDHRSDLYSVGVLFYQMLEGKLPYVGESAMGTAMKHILDPIPELSPQWQFLQWFIDRAMAKTVADRFQSGKEMITALESLR